jgi:hypothetical protein
MFNAIVSAGDVGAGTGATSRYGSGSDKMMRLLADPAPAPQHCLKCSKSVKYAFFFPYNFLT